MSPQPRGLGRGLGALIPAGPPPAPMDVADVAEGPVGASIRDVPVDNIMPNPQHRVDTVTPQNFRQQLDFLKRNGCQVLHLRDLVAGIKKEKKLPRKSVVITFDDGIENNFSQAFPVLKEYGMTAAFFVSGDNIGRPGYLTWEQLRLMQAQGMDIGCHGMTEAYLPDIPEDKQRYEIEQCKRVLEAGLKTPIDYYAYSISGFSPQIKEIVRKAGYQAAMATNRGTVPGQKDLFELRRIKITDRSSAGLSLGAKVSGFYNIFRPLKKPY